MAVLFDLDQTIVDSSIAEALRDSLRWKEVYDLIPRFSVFEGLAALLGELHQDRVPIAIVTSSPQSYCQKVVAHFCLPCTTMVCYHDAPRKPRPDPYLLAMKRLGVTTAIAVGDLPKDIHAARAAGIPSIGVSWGLRVDTDLIAAQPDYLCRTVEELSALLKTLLLQKPPEGGLTPSP